MAVARHFTLNPYAVVERVDLGRRFLRFATILLITISILAPVVRLSADFWLKLELVLLPFVLLGYTLLLLAGLARPIHLNRMLLVAPIFCVCILLSIFYGTKVINHPLFARDFFEIAKAIIPALFFTLAYEADLSERSIRNLASVLSLAVVPICLYAYGQWLNLGFTAFLQPYYSGGLHDDGGLAHYRRVYSTLSNPNFLAILMTWMIAWFTIAALFRVGNRIWNLMLLFACLATLAMTGSRYGLIDTVLALLLIFLLPSPTESARKWRTMTLLAAIPLLLGAILIVSQSNQATLERVLKLQNPLQENSLRLRLDGLWKDAGDKFFESPIVGHGPAKIIFGDIVTDSEYLDILKEFGLLGFIPYLCYFLVPLAMIWKGLRLVNRVGPMLEQEWSATYWALCLSFIFILTALVMNIGMSTYYNPSLLAFLWMWMGIGSSCARRLSTLFTVQQQIA
jgi:O-antigen ligase